MMFLERPVLGTGLGDYSLVRSNPDYLGLVIWIPLIVRMAGAQFYFAYHWLFWRKRPCTW